jgi:cellobiose phosphorylase
MDFIQEANDILSKKITQRVNSLGGYSSDGDVIYEKYPMGCPSVLVDKKENATATYMSNGSIDFSVSQKGYKDIKVLEGSFDAVEKRETSPMSGNIWMNFDGAIASLINPKIEINSPSKSLKFIKKYADNSVWYTAVFSEYETAVKICLKETAAGPALIRKVFIRNLSKSLLSGKLWTYFKLNGTQEFAYNKEIWYDAGLPLSPETQIVSASVPYRDCLQIKKVHNSCSKGIVAKFATCDYQTFIGDTSAFVALPDAVKQNGMLNTGAKNQLSRFNSPVIAATEFDIEIQPGEAGIISQSLLFVSDEDIMTQFRNDCEADEPTEASIISSYRKASKKLVEKTSKIMNETFSGKEFPEANLNPSFSIEIPENKLISNYVNSVWSTVDELYENCRAHGKKLADGIELGTRDRGQDMWPKMKSDPLRVRKDLVHALSFMYQTESLAGNVSKLSLAQKLHGMFPRQYPSTWNDRSSEIDNDNRPYTDSPIWLIDSLNFYIRQTGDISILEERVPTVRLINPENPEKSNMTGAERKLHIIEVIKEIFECYKRHCDDSPYNIVQILYGDWCDPVDMFGTSIIGDASTRGQGRGGNARLSAHVFTTLVKTIDLLNSKSVKEITDTIIDTQKTIDNFSNFADALRQNVVKVAWEDESTGKAGFIDSIHELNKDGSVPNYANGEIGYTLGSFIKEREFDSRSRRMLTTNAWSLEMINIQREYLTPVANIAKMNEALFDTLDNLFFDEQLGLKLFSIPISNNEQARRLVGRMGLIPVGCAENGEYHHAQIQLHFFRLGIDNNTDKIWKQFMPMLSVNRDESLCGPFETMTTSYVSDRDNPHFGKGMYFGLSGSIGWIVDFFQKMVGLELNLHDPSLPDLSLSPHISFATFSAIKYKTVIHINRLGEEKRHIPLTIEIKKSNDGKPITEINGIKIGKSGIKNLTDLAETC